MPCTLVIEDDVGISLLMSDALTRCGFEVELAANGEDGMARVREWSYDLIVLDLMMPVMDGWEFARRYRELPGCADRPILVLSAAGARGLGGFGNYEFLAKPFELDDFIEAASRLAAGG